MSSQPKRPNQIFICYRREDTAGVVGRIYDRLVQRFGKDAIFKDVDSLPLGRDFRRHIDSVVSDCCVALVVVGDRWIGASGARRLDDPRDYVRIEIESALKRDIPVIPLLVQNAELPPDESLPDSLKDFAYRNGMSIGHDPHFHADMDRLIKHLEELIEDRRKQEETQLATTPPPIPAPEPVARPDRQDSSGAYQHPIQVSQGQERPPVASMASGSPQTSAAASQHVETQTDFWIAQKDRPRIAALHLCFWPGVALIWIWANSLLVPIFHIDSYESYRNVLTLVSLLVSLVLAGGQAMILTGYIGSAKRWIGYTVGASFIENLLLSLFIRQDRTFVLAMSYHLTEGGALINSLQSIFILTGLYHLTRSGAQWLILRTLVKRAWLWIAAGVMAALAYGLIVSAGGLPYLTTQRKLVLVLLSSSLTAAAQITCLIRFRRKADASPTAPPRESHEA